MSEERETLDDAPECGLPVALEVMGERWSFMILRAAFNGIIHFEAFLSGLGIARNILSNRLGKLVEHGIMRREHCPRDRRKVEYRLTEKGADLLPAMLALRQWGERHCLGAPSNPVMVDRRDRLPIERIAIRAHDGRVLGWPELQWQDRCELGRVDGEAAAPPGLPALKPAR